MIKEVIKRIMSGIAAGGLATFIVVTVFMLKDDVISATILWFNMLGGFGIGIYSAVSSLIFESESWSRLKQLCIHFPMSFSVYFLIAVPLDWVPFTIWTVILVLVALILYYSLFWLGFWIYAKKQAAKLNDELKK